jgi:hypothetical protein
MYNINVRKKTERSRTGNPETLSIPGTGHRTQTQHKMINTDLTNKRERIHAKDNQFLFPMKTPAVLLI